MSGNKKRSHAARATGGLPGGSRAAWRRCKVCNAWVVAAFTDAHIVMLTPKELDRAAAVKAMQDGVLLYHIRHFMKGKPGLVVWQNPVWLAREMLAAPEVMPPHIYAEHPHRGIQDPTPADERGGSMAKKKSTTPDGPPPF